MVYTQPDDQDQPREPHREPHDEARNDARNERNEERLRRSLVMPALSAIAGFAILIAAILLDQAVSVGSALGVLLLLSAAVRFEIARRT